MAIPPLAREVLQIMHTDRWMTIGELQRAVRDERVKNGPHGYLYRIVRFFRPSVAREMLAPQRDDVDTALTCLEVDYLAEGRYRQSSEGERICNIRIVETEHRMTGHGRQFLERIHSRGEHTSGEHV